MFTDVIPFQHTYIGALIMISFAISKSPNSYNHLYAKK